MRRIDRFAGIISPGHRFTWGILMLLCFLFSSGLIPRLVMTLFFALLAILAGKRIRFGYFVFMIFSITVFNLLTPWGPVLFSVGRLAVTGGALEAGVTKGLTICGLVFVSLFSVSSKLILPGRLGRLLGRSFYYFERLYSMKKKVRRASFFADIDEILLSLFPSTRTEVSQRETEGEEAAKTEVSQVQTALKGWLAAGSSLAACALLMLI